MPRSGRTPRPHLLTARPAPAPLSAAAATASTAFAATLPATEGVNRATKRARLDNARRSRALLSAPAAPVLARVSARGSATGAIKTAPSITRRFARPRAAPVGCAPTSQYAMARAIVRPRPRPPAPTTNARPTAPTARPVPIIHRPPPAQAATVDQPSTTAGIPCNARSRARALARPAAVAGSPACAAAPPQERARPVELPPAAL